MKVLKLDHKKCAHCWHRCPDLRAYDEMAQICAYTTHGHKMRVLSYQRRLVSSF